MPWNTNAFDSTGLLKDARLDVGISLDTIPALTIATGKTIDMSVYINGSVGSITDSQIIGLDTDLATYSHATKLVTGVSTGTTMTGLQYEVTF